jgi:hypothetical protein
MEKRTCSEDTCTDPVDGRGLCRRHYNYAYIRGILPPRQLRPGVHSLSNLDRAAQTADCTICGKGVAVEICERPAPWKHGRYKINCQAAYRWSKRSQRLRDKYRLSAGDYDRMYAAQNGCCAICGGAEQTLSVDHDHVTGTVRGLLCRDCNLALGWLRDSAAVAMKAAQYLSASPMTWRPVSATGPS